MSNRVYVIDASVFVAAFSRQEPHYRTVQQLLAQISAHNWQKYMSLAVYCLKLEPAWRAAPTM